jgi:hypothetical protein
MSIPGVVFEERMEGTSGRVFGKFNRAVGIADIYSTVLYRAYLPQYSTTTIPNATRFSRISPVDFRTEKIR